MPVVNPTKPGPVDAMDFDILARNFLCFVLGPVFSVGCEELSQLGDLFCNVCRDSHECSGKRKSGKSKGMNEITTSCVDDDVVVRVQ